MRVLWLSNVVLPIVAASIGTDVPAVGGWLDGISRSLIERDITLISCFPHSSEIRGTVGKIDYFGFKQNDKLEDMFVSIINQSRPDVVHIFGTEYRHTQQMVVAAERAAIINRVIISIQGLVSVYAQKYTAGLPIRTIIGITPRFFIKHDNTYIDRQRFIRKGTYEIAALEKVKHVIGRTDWDQACVHYINPKAKYHDCNETLRAQFYHDTWDFSRCERHSIFVSQCNYPIKGFHYMLQAMPFILKDYPDAVLYTTGRNVLEKSIAYTLRKMPYEHYLASLIKKHHLEKHVVFLGTLNAEQMKERFLRSHVFVSPSVLENSPNSVGEAMILGMPVVTSDVGGVRNLIRHGDEGYLYPADEPYMLAYYVKKFFDDQEAAAAMGTNARKHAMLTHSPEINLERLLNIYHEVVMRDEGEEQA